MKRNLLLATVGLFLTIAGCSGSQQAGQQEQKITTDTEALLRYQDEITADFLKQHLSAFAADSMEGRETGMKGQKMAADYLASQYRKMGLRPVGDDSTYFQKFKLNATKKDSVVFETFALDGEQKKSISRSVASENSSAEYIRAFGGTDSLKGKIVFGGFGVKDAARNINHLKGADLAGKWVLVFQEIPHVVDGDTVISPASGNRARFGAIMGKGAEGILLISDMSPQEYEKSSARSQGDFSKPSGMRLAYRDKEGASSQQFSKGYNVVSPKMAAQLLGLEGVSAIEGYRKQLIENVSDFEPESLDFALSQIPYSSDVSLETENVLAFLEGADPELKEEVVVITSHYDHVGIGEPDSTGDRIYNGADDDGSGTIGLVNIGKALTDAAKNGVRPKRSILLLNVTGEEKGLLGSRYYSDHPVFPIDKTVANLNTDMIGRIDKEHKEKGVEEYSYIIGSELISSELDSLMKVANQKSGQIELNKRYNDLQDPNQFYRRSDHWNFGRLGVPFAFFFTGVHEDYHRPSDEVHKIRFPKMAKILRTIYATGVMVANADEAPTVDNQEFIEITKEN